MKSYMITGATSGIGETVARELAREGNILFLVGRNKTKLKELKNELAGEVITIEYDLSDLENIEAIFKTCKENNCKLDGMIYCAGIDSFKPVKVINENDMQNVMNVNCFAFVMMCKYFYSKRYSNDGSSIVVISSLASFFCDQGMIAYNMSKAAINSAVKTMAKEFVKRKIRVNAILPGGVSTHMGEEKGEIKKVINSATKHEDSNTGNHYIQALGAITCMEIVEYVKLLLHSNFSTGELVTVSGGRISDL